MPHAHGGSTAPDVEGLLHARGLRVTSQRRRVVAALAGGEHLTPDAIVAAVGADGGEPLAPSTVYRTLDTLEDIGVVEHTHLTHGPPTYHLAGQGDHLHLVCRACGAVEAIPVALADDLAARLHAVTGFVADLQHMGIHGRCTRCAPRTDPQESP